MTTEGIRTLGIGRFDMVGISGSTPVAARLWAVGPSGSAVVPRGRELLAAADDVPTTGREVLA